MFSLEDYRWTETLADRGYALYDRHPLTILWRFLVSLLLMG